MKPEIVNLIERPYHQLVDDILTSIVGGVVNEPIIYDIKEDLYPLSQPASDLRSITGTVSVTDKVTGVVKKTHHIFQKKEDFTFAEANNAVEWLKGGIKPDDETFFYVDYFRRDSNSPLTDINIGSVTRILSEAIGREIATVYEQINQVYRSAFIDTATGKSLDLVVSILGVVRRDKDFATGLVTFLRDQAAADGTITIPEGTLLSTTQGVTFATTELRALQRGQVRADIPVRATDAFRDKLGVVPDNSITILNQNIAGIAKVTNLAATVLNAEAETDDQLRARAKAALRALGKATLAALDRVISEKGAKLVEIWDPNSAVDHRSNPGTVSLLVETDPKLFQSLQDAVNETRAAGIQATLIARYVFFRPRLIAIASRSLTPDGKIKLIAQIIDAMKKYVGQVKAGDAVKGEDLLKAIKDQVKDVKGDKGALRFVDVMAWEVAVPHTSTDTLVEDLVTLVTNTPATELRAALARALSPSAPSGTRKPNRGLVQGMSGQPATDAEIEEGKFQVVPPTDKDKWWIVLDVAPTDIALAEGLNAK